jgi:hypothetical protein
MVARKEKQAEHLAESEDAAGARFESDENEKLELKGTGVIFLGDGLHRRANTSGYT